MKLIFCFLILILFVQHLEAQTSSNGGAGRVDEIVLMAQTKQLGQFIRRFNCEEDRTGKVYTNKDSMYRNPEMRLQYLNLMFDEQNHKITSTTKKEFIETITNKPSYLQFKDSTWFAEVKAKFTYKGKKVDVILYMQVEKENLGSKWIIANVYFDEFNKLFFNQPLTDNNPKFIHPLSHELDFMNLRKIFANNNKSLEFYASKNYTPDHLTLFFYEIKMGNLKFETVETVKFHFFQIDGWYFEVSEFNRATLNSGWLVSNLFKVSETEKKRFFSQIVGNRR